MHQSERLEGACEQGNAFRPDVASIVAALPSRSRPALPPSSIVDVLLMQNIEHKNRVNSRLACEGNTPRLTKRDVQAKVLVSALCWLSCPAPYTAGRLRL